MSHGARVFAWLQSRNSRTRTSNGSDDGFVRAPSRSISPRSMGSTARRSGDASPSLSARRSSTPSGWRRSVYGGKRSASAGSCGSSIEKVMEWPQLPRLRRAHTPLSDEDLRTIRTSSGLIGRRTCPGVRSPRRPDWYVCVCQMARYARRVERDAVEALFDEGWILDESFWGAAR